MIDKHKLKSFHILERENNKNLVTWTYPTITDDTRHILLSKCFVLTPTTTFFCLRSNAFWIYVQQVVESNSRIAIIVITEKCDITTYKNFCKILMSKYQKSKNPVDLVKLYLTANKTGSCLIKDNGNLINQQEKEIKVLDVVKKFGAESIFLYTALLLKRRILIYYEDIEELQKVMLAIGGLCSRRNLNEYFIPLVENLSEIRGLSFYLAGTTRNLAHSGKNTFDLYVDLHKFNIQIEEHSKNVFALTKAQKSIGQYFLEAIENNINENEFMNNVNQKTEELVNNIKSLATNNTGILTLNDLRSKNFSKTLENFLFNLGIVENIVMV